MVGTAVARIVASIATSPVVSMSAMRIGPRSDRKPTLRVSDGLLRVHLATRSFCVIRGPGNTHL